jgi:methionyl-tRNA formyltransferase
LEVYVHRVVFLGTPDFAVPSLATLDGHPEFDVVGVVTQPDRPAGRGQQVRFSPVKEAALARDLPVFQPKSVNKPEALDQLAAWNPDMLVVAAFGQILKPALLELAPHGSINVHASLLPRWRGAAPIHYAIRAGDVESGVTIMKMDAGLDTGPMLASRAIPIAPDETAESLHDKLAQLGADLLPDTLRAYLDGNMTPTPQPDQGITYAPTLDKEDGRLDWTQSAVEIDRHVRAYDPWPGTYTFLDNQRLKVISGTPLPEATAEAAPGTLVDWDPSLAVQTGSGLYTLDAIQPAGKTVMGSGAYLAGHPDAIGLRLK